ncbi:hypothetical protein G6F68_015075 [Rhizopus microsporus]|nr:hypothetical protein G6F68_015075 [Rhizopus microsporus]
MALVFIHHHAAAQGARRVQGAARVQLQAIVVPRPGLAGDDHRRLRPATLAHQVDRRARVARAAHQAGGAAHHFNAVVDERVVVGFAIHRQADGGRHAVVLQAVDIEPARPEVGAVANAGSGRQYVDASRR